MINKLNITSDDDLFSYFYEKNDLETQAEAILEREQRNAPVPPEGGRAPFISLDHCSDEEKKLMEEYFHRQIEKKQQKQAEQDTPKAEMPPNCFGFGPPVGMIHQLGALLHGDQKKSQEANAYDAMTFVLSRLRIVYWDDNFYYQNGETFQVASERELKIRIFQILEPMIASGKSNKIVNTVVDMLRMNPYIQATQTSDRGDRVFFLNGAYSISRQEYSPLLPTDFFTTYIPVQYIPQNSGCPYFDSFLQRISGGDERIVRLIWEMIGYLLAPDMEGKVFFVLQGPGNTGKSVLGNLIGSLFNDEAVAHIDIYRFRDRFAPAELRGKRVNISMDLPRTQLSREAIGVIKQITGDDMIATEQKFKAIESQKPTCKLLFGSNFPLMPADNDEAFRRRLITIPFLYPVPPEEQDKHLLEKLMGERLAIVIKALAALRDLRARNYQFIRVDQSIDVNGYVVEHQLMDEFLTRFCCFDPAAFTFTADLMDAYNIFRTSRNIPPLENSAAFSRQLNQFCAGRIEKDRMRQGGKNQNGYRGIRIINLMEA